MRYTQLRDETNCLNCGSEIQERYCSSCGQLNSRTDQRFTEICFHFLSDLLHYDGKLVNTLGILLRYPGKVPAEYSGGRRARFVDPIRMYLFTSAVFFFVLFSMHPLEKGLDAILHLTVSKERRRQMIDDRLMLMSLKHGDSSVAAELELLKDSIRRPQLYLKDIPSEMSVSYRFSRRDYASIADYNRTQSLLPVSEKDGWLLRKLNLKALEANRRFAGIEGARAYNDFLLHKLPTLLFCSLPVFIWMLTLVFRGRRPRPFAHHAAFGLFTYIFLLFLCLVLLLFLQFPAIWRSGLVALLSGMFAAYWIAYFFHAVKRFYGLRWSSTIARSVLLMAVTLLCISLLLLIFLAAPVFLSD